MTRYILANPTGNMTVLVESPTPHSQRLATAAAIMAAEPEAEQLGFLSPGEENADIALTMAGGEFCGNACLSAAAWYLHKRGMDAGEVSVAISGADSPVSVQMRREAENFYSGFVNMPLPLAMGNVEGFTLVSFPGISHVIVPRSLSPAEAEAMVVPLCKRLGAEALGLMLFDSEASSLKPLVYVPGAGSLFWERSCASGTTAVGAALAAREGRSISLSLNQPGGSLSIEAAFENGRVSALRLGGRVKMLPEKNVEI